MRDDTSSSIELSRRGVLGSFIAMGAASTAAGAGTVALFSDEETSSNNTVQAGTLDLTVNGSGSNAVFDVSNAVPGDSGSTSTTLRNDGSLPGYLTFGITGFRTPENGVNEPESGADAETDPHGSNAGGDHTGELAQRLLVRMKLVVDGTDHYLVGTDSTRRLAANVRLGEYDLSDAAGMTDLELDSGQEVEFVTDYEIPSDVGNEIQSDGVTLEAVFALTQERGQTIVPEVREVDAETIGIDGNDAGVRFDLTNDFGQEATITDLHVQPEDQTLTLLSDLEGGSGYRDGNYDFGADVYIDADTDGWVDGGSGEFLVPGWIDLSADGFNGSADREAILSAGSTATTSLYAFRQDGSTVDMTDKTVRVTLEVTLSDGTETFVPLVMTPD